MELCLFGISFFPEEPSASQLFHSAGGPNRCPYVTALLCRPVLVTQKLLAAFPLGVPSVGVLNYACLSLDTSTCSSARAKSKHSFPQPGKTMGWGNGSSLPSPQQAALKMLAPRPALYSIESSALESHCLSFASMIGLHIPHGGVAGEAPLCVAAHTLVPQRPEKS